MKEGRKELGDQYELLANPAGHCAEPCMFINSPHPASEIARLLTHLPDEKAEVQRG